jgi:hypothetical protein
MKGSVSKAVRVLGRFPFARPPHSPLVGKVVNLEGARLLFRRVLDNPAVVRSPLLGAGVLGQCSIPYRKEEVTSVVDWIDV